MVFEPVVVVHISPKSSGGLEHITYVYIVDIYICTHILHVRTEKVYKYIHDWFILYMMYSASCLINV